VVDSGRARQEVPEAHTRAIIEAALAGGVRYFDTRPTTSFPRSAWAGPGGLARQGLPDHQDEPGRPSGIEEELAASLYLLKTDHVDLLLLHCVGLTQETRDPQAVLSKGGALDVLREIKRRGQARSSASACICPR